MMAVASGVWAEAVPLETAWNLAEVSPSEDRKKKTMKQELERIGYLGSMQASYRDNPFAAHFELHIEQGPILEDEGRKVGVVKGGNPLSQNIVQIADAFQAFKHSSGSTSPCLVETPMPELLPFPPAKMPSSAPRNSSSTPTRLPNASPALLPRASLRLRQAR